MSAVIPFYQSKCSHELLVTFTRSVSQIISKHSSDLFIGRQYGTLSDLIAEMDNAFQRTRGSSFTIKRSDLDTTRDTILVATRAALDAAIAQEFLDVTKADNATMVKTAMDKMPSNVISLGYNEESAHISAFLSACQEMGEVITKAGVHPLIQALHETQAEFDKLSSEKIDSEGTEDKVRHIRHIRKDIHRRIDGLFGYIDLNGADLSEEFGETVSGINALISEVMTKAKADRTRSDNTAM